MAADQKNRTPIWNKLALSVGATVVFFVILELVLAVVGVAPVRYVDDPYVGFSSLSPLFVEEQQSDGALTMVTAANKLRLFNAQRFSKSKPEGTTRIFCVGGSTTYGRPYDDTTSFCGWLRVLLPAADPSRRWEVINAGGVSYASYRVAVLVEELVRYQPDLFVVYSGHNEFLERRSYPQIVAMPPVLRGVGALAARTRTHAVLRRAMGTGGGLGDEAAAEGRTLLEDEVSTRLDDAVGLDAYTRDDGLREKVLDHFRFNLARIVDIARSEGARTLLVTPACNLRQCTPFKSENRAGLSEEERRQWLHHVAAAGEAIRARHHDSALSELEAAAAIDDRHAHLHYVTAQVLLDLARPSEARRELERARDEDVCALRALGAMQGLVADVAADRGVPLVDFSAVVDGHSEHGIPGANLFLDHVHPTIEGNRMLALSIIERMEKESFLVLDPSWGPPLVKTIAARVEAGLDEHAHAMALMKLSKVLGWASKLKEAYTLAQRAVALDPNDARIRYQAGLTADLLDRVDESIVHYRRAIELQPTADLPHGNLGVAMEKKGDLPAAISHYRSAVEHGTSSSMPRHRRNLAMALGKLAVVELRNGRIDEALAALAEADELQPDDAAVLSQLATTQFAAGRSEEAVGSFARALELAPDNAQLHNRQAIALMVSGRREQAIHHYRLALSLDPELGKREDSLPSYLARIGRPEEAEAVRRQISP